MSPAVMGGRRLGDAILASVYSSAVRRGNLRQNENRRLRLRKSAKPQAARRVLSAPFGEGALIQLQDGQVHRGREDRAGHGSRPAAVGLLGAHQVVEDGFAVPAPGQALLLLA